MTRRVLLQKEMPNPFGLYFHEGRIYWSDYEKHTIQSANAQTGSDRRLVREKLEGINNIMIYHKQRPEGNQSISMKSVHVNPGRQSLTNVSWSISIAPVYFEYLIIFNLIGVHRQKRRYTHNDDDSLIRR